MAIKEKVKSGSGVLPQRRGGKGTPAPPDTRSPAVKKAEAPQGRGPLAGRGQAVRSRALVAGKAGAGAAVRPARVRVARVRYPSPERRLASAFRRMYRSAVAYLRETRVEMRKVVWPSRREAVVYTLVVVVASAAVGLLVWVFDIGLSAVLRLIIR